MRYSVHANDGGQIDNLFCWRLVPDVTISRTLNLTLIEWCLGLATPYTLSLLRGRRSLIIAVDIRIRSQDLPEELLGQSTKEP